MFFPKRLVFSGGGTRCLVFLPALRRLEQEQRLRNVSEWWGTSAGALLASLLGITRSAVRVHEIMQTVRYDKFRDISLLNMVNFTTAWGLDDGHSMVSELERIFEEAHPGASQWTLADVSGVRIIVADLNAYETVVCSETTFPTLRIVDAVRASMSLPVMYRPFLCPVNGHIWVDGGLRAAFPWECLPTKEAREEALGFAFEKAWIAGPNTFTEYIFSMLHFEDPKQIQRYKSQWNNILWFPSPPFPAWYVRLGEEEFTLLQHLSNTTIGTWLKHELSRKETSQSRRSSEDHCTPLQENPEHRTNGTLGIPPPFLSPSQAPSRGSQEHRSRWTRRWSL